MKYFLLLATTIALFLAFANCSVSVPMKPVEREISEITLPEGFKISYFAKDIENARSLCRGDRGTIFVGTRKAGNVYALVDENNDYQADKIITLAKELNMPNGVAFKDGALYVAEVNKVWRYDDIENNLDNIPEPVLVRGDFPEETHHGWKFIRFGPDGKLYIPVGAPCNICEKEEEHFASIMRMNVDGTDLEVFAHGVRNSVGFDWHPTTGELWFTDNGRDWLDDDTPPCELNHAPEKGMHFGYPYCHGGTIKDPKFGDKRPCSDFIVPAQNLGAHVAPLGMRFYTGEMFPKQYKHQIFIAEHGSWNRSDKIGYRVILVELDENHKATSYKPFAEGWLKNGDASGRPVDVMQMPDGSLLVSDDFADAIYRISYE
ncbi:MAG: PQQ-dependent sugar dehydrogenase [Chitinophagales bacterium]